MIHYFRSLSNTQKKLGLVVSATFGMGLLGGVAAVFPDASNQGYAPEQPIPFSHKLHAGENKIECRYCHTAADKSQHATVPPMNVCMGCHNVVKTDSPHIKKLTEHFKAGKPIEWVRIHELPDHTRFNHQPHITAGVACETCHGNVAEMERLYQAEPLTMGWCLQCHRGETTPKEIYERYKSQEPDASGRHHVAPINCSTCHY